MKIAPAIVIALSIALSSPVLPQDHERRIYLCRSPLLAFDFWQSLQALRTQGIKLTPEIAQQVCDGMKAGVEHQCIRVQMATFKPIAAGWGGAMALTDGKTTIWFHNPDSDGWVNPEYYVELVNYDH